MAANRDLWGEVDKHLKGSRYLLLLASRGAAKSDGVRHEIEFWIDHRTADTLLIAHTDGTIAARDERIDWSKTDALPQCLKDWLTTEPLYPDLRGNRRKLVHAAAPRLAAPVLGKSVDRLVGDDVRERKRTVRTIVGTLSAFLVVAVVAAIVSIGQRNEAVAQRQEAEEQRRVATGRLLTAEAENLRDTDPATSLAASLAALRIAPTPDVRTDLVETLMSTHLVGTAARSGDPGLLRLELAVAPNADTAVTSAAFAETGPKYRYETIVWDTTNPARWARAATLPEQVRSGYEPEVALGADGRTLATIDGDLVALWDLGDRSVPRRVGDLPAPDFGTTMAFGQEDRVLAVSGDGGVRLWHLEDRARPRQLADLPQLSESHHVVFSPDGRTLATTRAVGVDTERSANDHHATLWDVSDPAHPASPTPVTGDVSATVYEAAFSPDGTLLATAGADGTVILWDVADRTVPAKLSVLQGHRGQVRTVAFSPQGTKLASGGGDSDAILWNIADPANPTRATTLSGHTGRVHAVAFSQDGAGLVTGSWDSTVNYWRVADRQRPAEAGSLSDHKDTVTDLAMSPDGALVATASRDDTAILWNLATSVSHELTGHTGDVLSVEFGRDGDLLVTAGADRDVLLWDVSDPDAPRRVGALPPDGAQVNDVTISQDGRTLITASGELSIGGHVTVWDIADPAAPARLSTIGETGSGPVELSPDGRTLAVGFPALELWDVSEPRRPHRLVSWDGATSADAFAFRPDGRVLAVAGARDDPLADCDDCAETSLMLVDITDPARPERLAVAAAGLPEDLAFSPDGRTLVTAGGQPAVWDVGDTRWPAPVATLTGHTFGATRVVFGADGRTVVTASIDDTAIVWDAGDLPGVISRSTELACAAVGTGFTEEQWAGYGPGLPRPRLCP